MGFNSAFKGLTKWEKYAKNLHANFWKNELLKFLSNTFELCRNVLSTPHDRLSTAPNYRVSIKSFPDYKHLLQENVLELYVEPQLEEFQPWIIFQQDGAPPHWGSHFRRFLDATFPNRWIGRDGPTPWPPRSPDITPLDFFLWGYVKDKVFSTPVPDITNLKARITDAFVTVTEDMLENTWREIDYRLDVLRATKGAHVEVY